MKPSIKKISFPLQDPYMFEPCCQMKVDEYGFFITWKSEGKVPSTIFYHSSVVYSLSHKTFVH